MKDLKRLIVFLLPIFSFAALASPPSLYFAFVVDGAGSMLYRSEDGRTRNAFQDKRAEVLRFSETCADCVVDLVILHPTSRRKRRIEIRRYLNGKIHVRRVERLRPSELPETLSKKLPPLHASLSLTVFSYFGHRPGVEQDDQGRFLSHAQLSAVFRTHAVIAQRPFDLTILSTCNGSTPSFLSGFETSRFIVASATPIHIRMFPLKSYTRLLNQDSESPLSERSYDFARNIFEMLAARSYSELSVSLLEGPKMNLLTLLQTNPEWIEHDLEAASFEDCEIVDVPEILHTFYQRARFTSVQRNQHSGLACPAKRD